MTGREAYGTGNRRSRIEKLGSENGSGIGSRSEIEALLSQGLSHPLQPTAYDTSWAARLSDGGGLAYPHLLDWLMERQHPDGSWGGQVPYAHDRLLTTLSIVVLLDRVGGPQYGDQRSRGEAYLRKHAGDLREGLHRTIGFELILPALLDEARELGLDLPYGSLGVYEQQRKKKLGLLPMDRLFETWTTALFSLEAFRKDLDADGAAGLVLENGSMVGSPSATAYLLSRTPGWRTRLPRSVEYLEDLLAGPDGGLPAVHPCDIFVRAWTLYYLQHGGLFEENRDVLQPHLDYLLVNLKPEGVGFSATSGFVDSDDTAITLLVLSRAGYDVDGSCLLDFEQDLCFAVHGHESNPSVSANIHILEALGVLPEEHRFRVKEKILGYLLSTRREGAYWRDKWHASVYYPTTRALTALTPHLGRELDPTLEWLLATQREDGSWGQYGPTTEETSLVLLVLLAYHRGVWSVDPEPLHRAAEYLMANTNPPSRGFPELWIGKSLYAPIFAINASRLAALALYQDVFGGRH